MAKEQEELFLERTRDVKMGTYGSGIGIAEGQVDAARKNSSDGSQKQGFCACGGSK